MFETVAPETFAPRSRRIFYETLPLSIAFHGLVIATAVIVAAWNVVFPAHTPRLSQAYSLASLPDPTPPPPPLSPAAPNAGELPKLPSPPEPIVAPTLIPDTIPVNFILIRH